MIAIGGFLPLSLCDYPGHVAAVVFTQGCNYRCPYCHNRELLPMSRDDTVMMSVENVLHAMGRRRTMLDGAVVSGGEPTLQPGLADFLRRLREMNLSTKLDTNGSNPEVLRDLLKAGLLDYVAMDVKAPWNRYRELAGVPVAVQALMDSVRLLADSGVPHEFRTTWVSPLLSDADLRAIRAVLPSASTHRLQRYVARSDIPLVSERHGVIEHAGTFA